MYSPGSQDGAVQYGGWTNQGGPKASVATPHGGSGPPHLPPDPYQMMPASVIEQLRASSTERAMAMNEMADWDDAWIQIQQNTFTNWINDQLKKRSQSVVGDLQLDLMDGIKLVELVEVVQDKAVGGRVQRRPVNQHQFLENINLALRAIQDDEIKLVNIGAEDILNGNLKLILGLIWSLILHYQIGRGWTKMPPKRLMLAWINAVVPLPNGERVRNFNTDWNNGRALGGLNDYCRPGLSPGWREMNLRNGQENCRREMSTAQQRLNVPPVLRPEDLSNPALDEFSGMTYLSYFMKKDAPGYNATLGWARKFLNDNALKDFTGDWNDGVRLCKLVEACGGKLPNGQSAGGLDPRDEITNCQTGMDAAERELGIQPIVSPAEMACAQDDHLGVMAYVAHFQQYMEEKAGLRRARPTFDPASVRISKLDRVQLKKPVDLKVTAQGADKKKLRVEVCPPSKRIQEVPITEVSPAGQSGVFLAKFTPNELGLWHISVLYNKEHCHGSPFMVSVYDPNGLRIQGLPEVCQQNRPVTFYADTTRAGSGELAVEVSAQGGYHVPCSIVSEDETTYAITFTPQLVGTQHIHVTFAGHTVPGSPFTTNCVDHRKALVSGDGLQNVPVNREASFKVDVGAGANPLEVQATIRTPSGGSLPVRRLVDDRGVVVCHFTPLEVGPHKIDITNAGVTIEGSPFTVKAYDPSKVYILNMPARGKVDVPVEFDIDVGRAGIGEMEIMVNKAAVPCDLHSYGNMQFRASFTPRTAAPHVVDIAFNRQPVPGSPWTVMIEEPLPQPRFIGRLDETALLGESLTLDMQAHHQRQVRCHVTDPSGHRTRSEVTKLRDGLQKVTLTPTKVGRYRIDLTYHASDSERAALGDQSPDPDGVPLEPGHVHIEGSPLYVMVYNPAGVKIGPVPIGIVGEPVEIPVDLLHAGEGKMEVQINKGTIPHHIDQISPHTYNIRFTPESSLDHYIDIRFNKHQVPGCPFPVEIFDPWKVQIDGDGMGGSIPANVTVDFKIRMPVSAAALKDGKFDVQITAPNGETTPAKITSAGNDFKVEYQARQIGRHRIEVSYCGRQIHGSPFFVDVFDPSAVRIIVPDDEVEIGGADEAFFDVDHANAGQAEVGVRVLSPSGAKLPFHYRPVACGTRVFYEPREVGEHRLYATYGGFDVPNCPASQQVVDGQMPSCYGDGLYRAEEDQTASFEVDARGMKGDLYVRVDGPNSVAKSFIDETNEIGIYQVRYTPVEVGVFEISVRWNDKELDNSPFHPQVVNPSKVIPIEGWGALIGDRGSNLDLPNIGIASGLLPNVPKRIEFDVSAAGPGDLTASVRGPRGEEVPCSLHRSGDGSVYTLQFTPTQEGPHELHLLYADLPHPDASPLKLACAKPEPKVDPGKVFLEVSDDVILLNERNEFIIDGSQAGKGTPTVKLYDQRNVAVEVHVEPLAGGRYRCWFVPTTAGLHTLLVEWDRIQIPGSPFRLEAVSRTDPSKVVVSGDGFKNAMLGQETKATIDARFAGPGKLMAHCMGPTKPALVDLYDHMDGFFTLTIRPQEAGRHSLQIKFDGQHVPGSPFLLYVHGPPDASKVRVHGPGIEHGVLSHYQSRFVCETQGAGNGQLTVIVRGPRAAFRVEMEREHPRDRTILCRYSPTEPGDYVIHVKWAGEHVPGSPFHVQIFGSEEEMRDFMTGGAAPAQPQRQMMVGPGQGQHPQQHPQQHQQQRQQGRGATTPSSHGAYGGRSHHQGIGAK